MAQLENTMKNEFPELIVLGPPSVFSVYSGKLAEKFRILKPWESSLPLEEFLSDNAKSVEALLCSTTNSVSASVLSSLPCLRLVVTTSAGLDHIDLPECRRLGIAVANAPAIFSVDVADLAVGLLIDVLRRISACNRFVKNGSWLVKGNYPLASKLGGKKVGIVGLGSIGQQVAKRLEAFGCIISYHSRETKKHLLPNYTFYDDLHQLAKATDVLVICCALTDQTHHLIDRDVLLALGKHGVIVNVARGAIVHEKELVQCLLKGEIAGAGLDVFEGEPHVPAELLGLDNVVLSPHYAAFTHESFAQSYDLIVGNLEAFFSNKPLLSPVLY
ncbi:unnamed protein product [Cuscuta europaea]|uniref:Glyoxylate/hydroxypyruvate reductase HPR3-like n=1 Tax=Cuscuta europaea TaxID=41803 RepID=A0A9P0ZDS6_CUSEU|nr:unnamed protein product [Cuscuta europaea]